MLDGLSDTPGAGFLHGVAAGEPTSTSLALWTRFTTDAPNVELRWEVSAEGAAGPARRGTVEIARVTDHTATVLAADLQPGTEYRYRFRGPGGVASPEGRARTLPDRASSLRIGVTTCARYAAGRFAAYRMLADERPDLVLHLGDYIYEDAVPFVGGRQPDPPWEPETLSDYRRRHACYALDTDLRALHHVAAMQPVWDDHDVVDNVEHEDEQRAWRRGRAGRQAWREWLPVLPVEERLTVATAADDVAPGELDRIMRIGGLADVIVIDTRYTGREPARSDGPSPAPRAGGELLTPSQWSWLERVVRSSTAPWRIIANAVQVAPMRLGYVPVPRRRPYAPVVNPDQWDGYPHERDRLYRLLDRTGPTLVLSGDLHSSWVHPLRHDGRDIAHELTVSSVAGLTYAEAFTERTHLPPAVLRSAIRAFNRSLEFFDIDRHGYLVIDVADEACEVRFVLLDDIEPVTSAQWRLTPVPVRRPVASTWRRTVLASQTHPHG